MGQETSRPSTPAAPASGQAPSPGWLLKTIYSVALLAPILGLLFQSSWVSMATGFMPLHGLGRYILPLVAALLAYRIYLVWRYKTTLQARPPYLLGSLLRGLGVLIMLVGAVGVATLVLAKPVGFILRWDGGPNGIAYFVVGVFAVGASSLGWIGCLLYEASRFIGRRTSQPSTARTPRQRRLDWSVASVLLLALVGGPLLRQQLAEPPCWGPSYLRCAAIVEGGIKRFAVQDFRQPVRLETNIETVVFTKSDWRKLSLQESPAFSLLKSGYPPLDDAQLPVLVRLHAEAMPKGVAISLHVYDHEGESASFITRLHKRARLQPGKDGLQQVIVDLPDHVQRTMPHQGMDPATKQTFIFDEIYSQLREAIVSPREAAEHKAKVTRSATEVSVASLPADARKKEGRPAESCRETVKLVRGADNEMSTLHSAGIPMHRLNFLATPEPQVYALTDFNEQVGCNADGVWIFRRRGNSHGVTIRRYSPEGQLLNHIETTAATPHANHWIDVDSPKIQGQLLSFSIVGSGISRGDFTRHVFQIPL